MKRVCCVLLCVLALSLGGAVVGHAAAKKEAPAAAGKKGGAESVEAVQAKLDAVGKKLVSSAAKTVSPSAKAKAVAPAPDGKGFVATYVAVDESTLKTELRPGTGPGGQYVGSVKYLENHYECRGATKAEAMGAPCNMVKSRRMNELIRYEAGKWSY